MYLAEIFVFMLGDNRTVTRVGRFWHWLNDRDAGLADEGPEVQYRPAVVGATGHVYLPVPRTP